MKTILTLWRARAAIVRRRVSAPLFHTSPLRVNSIEYTLRMMEARHA